MKVHLTTSAKQFLSVFDIFKIGVGPSSSHTMGPWNAAAQFAADFVNESPASVQVELYGSLAKTGRGHATDVATVLGLCGSDPKSIDVDSIGPTFARIKLERMITLAGRQSIDFDPTMDIRFCPQIELPTHPNAMKFIGGTVDGRTLERVVYSIGGGFIIGDDEVVTTVDVTTMPLPILSGADLLRHCRDRSLTMAQVVNTNELVLRHQTDIDEQLERLIATMIASVHRGCQTDGMLPGPLRVRRRAADMARTCGRVPVVADVDQWLDCLKEQSCGFKEILNWVSCFALAVNEENAAMGRIVTAPTNGAAGVIPAVLLYHLCFCDGDVASAKQFLLAASEIGCLFKRGATISAAMGGCQAEIGVSSAMAAAGLCEVHGGSPRQSAMAAEIAMEHHLGLTCDPIGGLVQIPCIERNAMGAIKAITAAQLALQTDPDHARVSLDDIVQTMWLTAQDMSSKYKETSEGGLAVQIPVSLAEC